MKARPFGVPAREWELPAEDVAATAPCQICGHPDHHHGFGRSCWDCPGGACQPRVAWKGRQP